MGLGDTLKNFINPKDSAAPKSTDEAGVVLQANVTPASADSELEAEASKRAEPGIFATATTPSLPLSGTMPPAPQAPEVPSENASDFWTKGTVRNTLDVTGPASQLTTDTSRVGDPVVDESTPSESEESKLDSMPEGAVNIPIGKKTDDDGTGESEIAATPATGVISDFHMNGDRPPMPEETVPAFSTEETTPEKVTNTEEKPAEEGDELIGAILEGQAKGEEKSSDAKIEETAPVEEHAGPELKLESGAKEDRIAAEIANVIACLKEAEETIDGAKAKILEANQQKEAADKTVSQADALIKAAQLAINRLEQEKKELEAAATLASKAETTIAEVMKGMREAA